MVDFSINSLDSSAIDLIGRVRARVRLGAIGATTAGMYAAVHLHMKTAPQDDRADIFKRWYRRWANRTVRSLGVRLDVSGSPTFSHSGPRLVVANHRCAADIPILLSLFDGRLLSRGDVAEWHIVGPLAKEVGTLFVDRASGNSGAAAIRSIRSALQAGSTIILFPEGTTYQGDEVQPFFAGAFAAARGLGAQVVPVGLSYPAGTEWWQVPFTQHIKALSSRARTNVAVTVGKPEPLEGKAAEYALHCRDRVQELVAASRRRLNEPATVSARAVSTTAPTEVSPHG